MIEDAFEAFLREPTRERYRRVRRLIVSDPEFRARSVELAELSDLLRRSRFEEADNRADGMWHHWRLCPRFHLLAGHAASCVGLDDEAELCRFQFQSCLQGILDTGRGTSASPYEVIFVCDEYDVLRALGRDARQQQVLERANRCLDVITCQDGTEIWFDVSESSPDRNTLMQVARMLEQTSGEAVGLL